jgi:hypothetical protein
VQNWLLYARFQGWVVFSWIGVINPLAAMKIQSFSFQSEILAQL